MIELEELFDNSVGGSCWAIAGDLGEARIPDLLAKRGRDCVAKWLLDGVANVLVNLLCDFADVSNQVYDRALKLVGDAHPRGLRSSGSAGGLGLFGVVNDWASFGRTSCPSLLGVPSPISKPYCLVSYSEFEEENQPSFDSALSFARV